MRRNPSNHVGTALLGGLVALFHAWAGGADLDPAKLPPPAAQKPDYLRDIKPILDRSCLKCHGNDRPKGDFSITTRATLLKGGSEGVAVKPGDSANSRMIHYVSYLVEDMEMPPPGKAERLSPAEVGLLRAWIDDGAPWDAGAEAATYAPQMSVTSILQWNLVDGNKALFREHQWQPDGPFGGFSRIHFRQRLTNGVLAEFEGRALVGLEDYQAKLSLTKPKTGFLRLGFEQFRKYYDDTGGYYPLFTPSIHALGRDLHLDVGRAWVEAGLTLPNLPRITLGYEHQYRDGAKSILQWGDVTDPAGTVRNLYPAWKEVDERRHVLKLNVAHDWRGWFIEDDFRAEFLELRTDRFHSSYVQGKTGPDKVAEIAEGLDQFQAVNTLRFEKQVKDWFFVSAGYFYQHTDGDASHSQAVTYQPPSLAAPPPGIFPDDKFWSFNNVILKQATHIGNLNLQLTPWKHLSLAAGIQPEWQHQEGFGSVVLDEGVPVFVQTAMIDANLDRASLSEDLGLRLTVIPHTVVFADARFRQESLDQKESIGPGNFYEFDRRTDASTEQREYRAGLSFSPWTKASFTGHFRRRERWNRYHHPDDLSFLSFGGFPNDGYSAFITGRQEFTDEWESKLVLRPAQAIKATLGYKYRTSDFRTATDEALFGISPGGPLTDAAFRGHTVSANLTLTPHPRFHLSSTFAWTQSRTTAFADGWNAVAPWRGTTWSLMNSATYILNKSTDLNAGYYFASSDFRQPHEATGLPYGLAYHSHVLHAGLTRRFGDRTVAGLSYAFYRYSEGSAAGARDYDAHGIFASLTIQFK